MRRLFTLVLFVLVFSGGSAQALLVPVEQVPSGTIIDHSSTKFLIADSGALRIRDRATGAEEHIPPIPDRPYVYGFLSPHGAIFVAGGESSLDVGVYEWRDGALIYHGFPNSGGSLTVKGSFAIWSGNPDGTCCAHNLYRVDLDTGVTTLVETNTGNTELDVAPNGDVVYWIANTGPQYEIFRWDGTASQQLTSDTAVWNTYPLTDGLNVVYRKHSPCCSNDTGSVAVYTSTGETVLDSFRNDWPEPRLDYDAAGGWVAYTRAGPSGELQTWRRAPDGAVTQVSPDGMNTRIAAIAPTGDILFSGSSNTLFSARVGSSAVDLGSPGGTGGERGGGNYFFQEGGRWFRISGRTIYEVATGYPRPRGATPARFSLVLAYHPCTAPNRVHGPPLAFDSCNPPQQTSPHLTFGTADANARPAKSESSVTLSAVVGSLTTPADEADVRLQVHINDVRRRDNLEDYTGEVVVDGVLRITDRDTIGLGGGRTHGTVRNIHFPVAVPCTATSDTAVGSTCALDTTFDAGVPAITEGRRTIWQLDQIQVFDGGPDGDADTDDNSLFAVQGIFVP
jgi:hypothetical protein